MADSYSWESPVGTLSIVPAPQGVALYLNGKHVIETTSAANIYEMLCMGMLDDDLDWDGDRPHIPRLGNWE